MKRWVVKEQENIADIALEVYGKDKEDLLQNILQAFTSIITDLKKIIPKEKISLILPVKTFPDLVFNFVEKLIYLKDAKGLLFKKGEFKIENKKITINLSGQKITPELPIRIDIKALTRHKFKVEKNNNYKINMVFDI